MERRTARGRDAVRPPRRGPRRTFRPPPGKVPRTRTEDREPTLVELRLPGRPEPHWARELIDRWGARLRLRTCRTLGSGGRQLLQVAEVALRPDSVPAVERFLRHRPELRQLSVVRMDDSRILVRTLEPAPPLCTLLNGRGAFCTTCRFLLGALPDGRPWSVVVPRRPASAPLLRALRRYADSGRGESVPIRTFRPARGPTERQTRALEVAHRLGYFRFPRQGGLTEVADALGVSRSTASELLRRGEAKAVLDTLDG